MLSKKLQAMANLRIPMDSKKGTTGSPVDSKKGTIGSLVDSRKGSPRTTRKTCSSFSSVHKKGALRDSLRIP